MLAVLRAFAWMRWRILMNSLERTGARDTLERFSLAIEQLGPIIAAVVLIPSAAALAGLAGYAGWAIAAGQPGAIPVSIVRFVLAISAGLAVIGPLLLPGAERAHAVRLLLLPIARRTLYAAQASSSLGDPWILLAIPIAIALPAGLAAGGAWMAAAVAAIGGLLLLAVLVGIATVAASLVHLVVRDRRRGELIALVFILVIPLVGMLPMLMEGSRHGERGARRSRETPAIVSAAGRYGRMAIPSELYFRGTREAAAGRLGLAPIAALGASAVLLHAAGLFIFGRLLDSSASVSSRRRGAAGAGWGRRIPGLSPGASAVALAQVRLALRTPRGRSILLSPLIVFVIFAVMMRRGQGGFDFGLIALESGLGLATFGAVVSLIAVLPIAMNQFAIDGAGFTLVLLTPLDDWDLLRGKAAGNALVAFAPALVCILGAALVFPGGHAALWACIPLGLLATYLLVAPAAAAFSALFPRAVDLNSIGRGSNAHGAAGFLGLFAFLAGGAPPSLLALLATRVLDRPALAPVLLAAWCLVCALLARLLFLPVKTLFASRRENLGMVHPSS